MDNIFAEQACTSQFREAFKELTLQQETTYITEEDKKLAETSETSDWVPHEHIIEYVPELSSIEVLMLRDNQKHLGSIGHKIIEEGQVGLVLMGPSIDRRTKPYLVVLTTSWAYYVIEPDYKIGFKFLMGLTEHPKKIKIYMSDILREADCLKRNYGIDLCKAKAKVICATGLHIYMMRWMRHMNVAVTSKYPVLAELMCYDSKPMIENFNKLVEIWLDIYAHRIAFPSEQLIQLTTRPLSIAAKSIIKKRCCLVVALNEVIEYYSTIEFFYASEMTYNTLTVCNDAIAEDLGGELLAEQEQGRGLIEEIGNSSSHNSGAVKICTSNRASDRIPKLSDMVCYYGNLASGLSTDKYKLIPEAIEYEPESDCE